MDNPSNKLAILFPGGGTQYLSMGEELWKRFKIADDIFEQANSFLGYDLKKLCCESTSPVFTTMSMSQPAIYTTSMAAYYVARKEYGITPMYTAGHSLGEYGALTCSGVLTFEQALELIRVRSEQLDLAGEKCNGAMAVINKIYSEEVEEGCVRCRKLGYPVFLSAENSAMQNVVSGTLSAVKLLIDNYLPKTAEGILLNIQTPSHCPLMNEGASVLGDYIKNLTPREPTIQIISNVTAKPYSDGDSIKHLLKDQLIKPVRWHESINYLIACGCNGFLDIGPQSILKSLMSYISASSKSYSFESSDDLKILSTRSVETRLSFKAILKKVLLLIVTSRNSNYNSDEYEKNVVIPYNNINKIINERDSFDDDSFQQLLAEAVSILQHRGLEMRTIKDYFFSAIDAHEEPIVKKVLEKI